MTILGIDPGTLVTGYAVLESQNGRLRVCDFGVVKNDRTLPLPLRLKAIHEAIDRVIGREHPDACAIETAFYGKNVQSALKLGHARGVAILAAADSGLPIAEYSPREVKKAVVGYGNASKEQVQGMVKALLRLRETPRLFDASDALAVALCHVQRCESPKTLKPRSANPRKRYADWGAFLKAHPEKLVQTK